MKVLKKVIIGIPVYNGAEYIRDTLESLQRQTFQNFLVLISDNLTTDNTRSICSEFFEKDELYDALDIGTTNDIQYYHSNYLIKNLKNIKTF